MNPGRDLERENKELRERMSRMGKACLRINESLDFKTVLQGVLDSARSLTDATYGMMTLLEDGGRVQNCLASGLTPNQTRRIWRKPENEVLFENFGFIEEPLRVRDMQSHIRTLGLPEFRPPMPVSPSLAFLAAPIRHGGERVGTFFLAEKEGGMEFTAEDEETLVLFATQAALVITNARRYRDERRARADLEALVKTSQVGVAVFEASTGEVISFNREAARILDGLRIPDRSLEDILDAIKVRRADGRDFSLEELSATKMLNSGETVRAEEIVVEGPDGRRVTVLANATPIRSDDGGVESLVVTVQDMTHLEELERQRSDFLAIVSHELRAPLAAIKGSAATVLGDTLALDRAEMVQFFRIINQHADQMSGLVNDLLDVARIRTGILQVTLEPTQVTGLVDQARNTFLSGGGRNNLRIELAPELPAVNADRRRINQVIVNLLSNADSHSPRNSLLRITVSQEGVHVAFSVVDHGRGVSAERLPHMFRNIVRFDGEDRTGEDEGSGWGLSICKGIVEAHGGRIWAESDGEGRGTRVTFTIPVAEDAGYVTHGPPDSNAGGVRVRRQGRTPILVVDDDPQTLRKVREALSKVGYVLVATGDPDEVPRLLEEHRPQLVLLDLVLPGTDGIEIMQSILKDADVPVVFLSAYGHDEAIARAFEAGAADYVVKPFSDTELVARIRAALRKATASVQKEPEEPFVMGGLTIDYPRRRVIVNGRPVRLTVIEYGLLVELSVKAGVILTHDHLLQRVWRKRSGRDTRPLRSALKSLRRKLGDDAANPTYIFNEPGVGYRMGAAE